MDTVIMAVLFRQRFDWISEDGKQKLAFDVTAMLQAIKTGELPFERIETEIDDAWARQCLPDRDIKLDHCRDLLRSNRVHEPVLGVQMPHGTTLLIDGSHRYYTLWRCGMKYIKWHIVDYPDWKPFAMEQ